MNAALSTGSSSSMGEESTEAAKLEQVFLLPIFVGSLFK